VADDAGPFPDGKEFEFAANIRPGRNRDPRPGLPARMPARKRQLACMILEALAS
jgi:hypothetical protein